MARSFLTELERKRSRGLRVGSAPISKYVQAELEAEARERRIRDVQARELGLRERALDIESSMAGKRLGLLEEDRRIDHHMMDEHELI